MPSTRQENLPLPESVFCRRLRPVGRILEDPDHHVWCCSPIWGDDGRVHVFYSRFSNRLPHTPGWLCDPYVYPSHRLGNVMTESLGAMVGSNRQRQFGEDKSSTLPKYCRTCDWRFACHGECPKHRFLRTPDGEPGLNYLCSAYKRFFSHTAPYMRVMVELLRSRQPASGVMAIADQTRSGKAPRHRVDVGSRASTGDRGRA